MRISDWSSDVCSSDLLADFKTVLDFAETVQSPERLRLLLVLTVVDIRAVGPGVWNGWKRQLLTELFDAAEEVLRLGHKQKGREARIASKKDAVAAQFGFGDAVFQTLAKRSEEHTSELQSLMRISYAVLCL